MFNGLKDKIAKKIAVKKFKPYERRPVKFNGFIRRSSSFLILLPFSETYFEESLKIVEHLKNMKKNISIIIRENFLNDSRFLEFELIPFSEEDKSRLGAPSKELISLLQKNEYDIYADLSFSSNSFAFVTGCAVKSKFKIAFNKKGFELFGNFLLPIEENNPIITYENFLNSLEMF